MSLSIALLMRASRRAGSAAADAAQLKVQPGQAEPVRSKSLVQPSKFTVQGPTQLPVIASVSPPVKVVPEPNVSWAFRENVTVH